MSLTMRLLNTGAGGVAQVVDSLPSKQVQNSDFKKMLNTGQLRL
jgi:hypothetical protein